MTPVVRLGSGMKMLIHVWRVMHSIGPAALRKPLPRSFSLREDK